jgi:hypothetical protein
MRRDQNQSDAGQFEWVNVWASASGATTDAVPVEAEAVAELEAAAAPGPARFVAAKSGIESGTEAAMPGTDKPAAMLAVPAPAAGAAAIASDQLMRDIAEIERARDALADGTFRRNTKAFMLVPSRTTDSVPLFVGGVLALVMLTAFGTAAAMTKFGR